MTLRQISGYLHHVPAIVAIEQLETYDVHRLYHLKPNDRLRGIREITRAAEGRPSLTPAERQAEKEREHDAGWARLRARLGGGGRRRPGDRVVIAAE